MGVIDKSGVQASLKTGPGSVEPENKSGGSIDTMGVRAPLKTEPASNQFYTNGKTVDSFAGAADLNKEPIKGWQSYDTPMSDRAKAQSK